MKSLIRLLRFAVLIVTAGLSSLEAAQPRLEPLLKPGLWTNAPSSTIQDLAVQGNYAYVAHRLEGLKIIDVSNPPNPVRVGEYDTTGDALGVAVAGNYAYVADGSTGLEVIDISEPAHPVHVGGCLLPTFGLGTNGYALGITVSGNYAYVTDPGASFGPPMFFGGLHVIDVSNPTNCVPVSKCATIEAPICVQIVGNYAYVGTSDGMDVLYVGDPSNCVSVASYSVGATISSLAVSGNRAYLFRDRLLRILDITNPTNVIHINTVTIHDTPADSGEIALAGNYAFMACDFLGVRVFDVSDPTNCAFLASFSTNGYAYTVNVAGGRIYVGDYPGGLRIFPTIPDVQFTIRVHAVPNVPLTLESTTNLIHPITWTQLVRTNLSTNQFDYADLDVRRSKKPQKYYRVVQP